MKTRSMLSWVAAFALVLLSTQAFAIDAEFYRLDYGHFKMGKFTLVPGLSVQAAYDDNIYLASGFNVAAFPTEKIVHDWLTYVKPAFGVEYDISGRGKIQLGYQGTLTYYSSETDNNWQNHQALLGVDYEAPSGWIFKLKNDYNNKQDPYGDANSFGIGDTGKRWKNTTDGAVGFRFGETFKTMLYGNYDKQVYDKQATRPFDFTQDYQAYEGGIGFEGKVMPKTWAFARYYYQQFDYDTTSSQATSAGINSSNDADYNRNRLNAGLSWDSGNKLGGELNLGWAWYNFKNEFDPSGVRYQDENTWVAFTSISFDPSEMTGFTFNLNRDLKSTGSQSKEFFIETQIGANITQKFLEKFEAFGGLTYAYQDYNTNNREDRNIQLNAGMDYFIMKWLSCGVEYIHMQKDSSSNTVADQQGRLNEYSDNRYLFKITAAY
ncbi:MAG: outer membrane beta-barrel protein [Pseudomonadota bacterium]